MNATLRLVGVELPRPLLRREPYVTAIPITSTSTGRVPVTVAGRERPDAVAAPPPEGAETQVAAPAEVSTEPAASVDAWYPLVLDLVLFEGDPGDWLLVRGSIMDSDADFRRAGARIDHARHAVDGTALASALTDGIGTVGVSAAVLDETAKIVTDLLRNAGDDLLLDWELRLEGVEEYRAWVGEFTIEDGRCRAFFSFAVDGLPSADTAPVPEPEKPGPEKVEQPAEVPEVVATLAAPADGVGLGIAVDSGEPVPVDGAVEPREPIPGEVLAEGEVPETPTGARKKRGTE